MTIKDEYLTTSQVSDRLGIARSTVNRWVREGKLPKYTLGGKNLFKPSDVDSLVKFMDSGNFIGQNEVEEPSDEELTEARLAFKEIEEELKSGERMNNNEDIMRIAAEVLAKSHLIYKSGI